MHTHLDEFAIDAASANTNLTCGIPLAQVAKENLICWNCSPDVGSSYPAGAPTCGKHKGLPTQTVDHIV